ncbi:MAG: hypothetical protein ACREX6_03405, partial [Casimicrobiaceae bacterium]
MRAALQPRLRPSRDAVAPGAGPPATQRTSPSRWQDPLFEQTTRFFAVLVLVLLAGIVVALAIASAPALRRFGPAYFVTDVWNPVTL